MATLFSLNDGNLTDSNVFGQTMSTADLFDGVSNLNVTTSYSNPSVNIYSITSDGSSISAVAVNVNYRATSPTGTLSMLLSSGASYITETYAISSFTPYDDRNNLISTASQNWQILKLTTPFSSTSGDKIRLDFKTSDDNQLALVGVLTAYESTKGAVGTFDGTFTQSDSPFTGYPLETSYKFSSSKANFSGYGDAVFGTDDFTIEFWFKLNTLTSFKPFIMKGIGYSGGGYYNDWAIFHYTGQGIRFSRYSDVATDKYFSYDPTTNAWTHLALCKKNNQLTLFINGSVISTQSDTTNYYNNISDGIQLGAGVFGGGWQYLDGYITNARVIAGKALYLKNFTVPTSPLVLDSGTKYQNYKSPTSPIYSSDITPFTGVNAEDGSLYFNGTTDYTTSPKSSAFDFPSGTFTIETWVNFSSVGTEQIIACNANNVSDGWTLELLPGKVFSTTFTGQGVDIRGTTIVQANTWYHVAVAGSAGSYKLFVNGIQEGSTYTGAVVLAGGSLLFGRFYDGSAIFGGYLSNFRIVNGTAVYTSNFQVPAAPLSNVANTSLLLKAPYSPLSRISIDYTKTPFFGGNAEPSSLYFNGTSDYLNLGNFSQFPLTGDFTIEFWVNFPANPSVWYILVDTWEGPTAGVGNSQMEINPSGKLTFYYDGNSIMTGNTTITTNMWHHVAVVRNNNSIRFYIDGILDTATPASFSGNVFKNSYQFNIGRQTRDGGVYHFNGYLSNIRIVKGTAVYTSNFTVPTAPLSNISGTAYLLKSPYDQFGMLSIQSPFGVGTDSSVRFNGTSDYLTIPQNPNFNFSSGTFTVEAWVRCNSGSLSVFKSIVNNYLDSSKGWALQTTNTGKIGVNFSGDVFDITGTTTLQADTWYHVAVAGSPGSYKLFLNGVQEGATFTGSTTLGGGPLYIGKIVAAGTSYDFFNGYMSNLRIVNGAALYTSNFDTSAPISPLTPLSSVDNTVLLLDDAYDTRFRSPYTTPFLLGSYGNLNKGLVTTTTKPAVYDVLSTGTLTKVGTPTLSSASPFGVGTDSSIYFSNNNYISVADSPSFGFGGGDFTIECWVYSKNSLSDYAAVFSVGTYANGILFWHAGNFYFNGAAYGFDLHSHLPKNTWGHVAVCRYNDVVSIYVNGVSKFSTNVAGVDIGASRSLTIGTSPHNTSFYLNGFISNFRVVKGYCVYTGNFTPSISPLEAIPNTKLLYKDPYNTNYIINNGTYNTIHLGGALRGLTSESRVLTASTVDVSDFYVHNQGKLVFPTDVSKTLTFRGSKGLQITSDGTLEIGTSNSPVSSTVQHNIILNNSQVDVHNGGNMNVYGAYKKPYTYLSSDSLSSTKSFTVVDSVSTSWLSGDSVVFTPNTYQRTSFDVLTLSSFDSGTTFKTTTNAVYNHPSVTSLGNVPTVSNLSRNVSIKGSLSSSRATVRAVDAAKVNIANTQFTNFGIASANKTGFVIGTNSSGYVSLSGNSFYSDGYSGTTHITTVSGKPVLGNLTLKDNVFFKSGGYGVSLSSVSATGLTVTGNTVLSANNSGLYFASVSSSGANMNNNTVIGSKSYGTFITNCTIDGDFGGAINYGNNNRGLVLSADHIGNLTNLISLYNTNEGIYIDGAMPGLSSTIFSNITSNNNTSTGIEVSGNDVNATSPIVLNMRNIVAKNNDGIGFEMYNISGNISSVYLDNNLNYGMKTSFGGETTIDGLSSFLVAGLSSGTLTKIGTPTLSSASPFGVGTDSSIYCQNGNYIYAPATSYLAFGTDNFTFECWFRPTVSPTGYYTIFSLNTYGAGILCRYYNNFGDLYFNGVNYGNWGNPNINQWNHIAVCRSSGVVTVYLNGVAKSTFTPASPDLGTSKDLTIGASPHTGGNEGLQGYISNFRVVKGVSVYSAGFTPTTSPLSVIGGTSLLYQAPYSTSYSFVAYRGQTAFNLGLIGGSSYYPIYIKNSNISTGNGGYYGIPLLLSGTNYGQFNVENSTLSSYSNAVTVTTQSEPVRGSYLFNNCKVGSNPVVGIASYQPDVFKTTGLAFTDMDNVPTKNATYLYAGKRSLDTSVNIDSGSSPSERLTPTSATVKLRSGSKFVALNTGNSTLISVYARKSTVASNGVRYNGNPPRLMLKANPIMGIKYDIVVAQFLVESEDFQQLSGTTPAVTDTGVLEFYVDCDGTQGWINLDNWSAI